MGASVGFLFWGISMERTELKEIIQRVLARLSSEEAGDAPRPACMFNDVPCDATTDYSVGEEA